MNYIRQLQFCKDSSHSDAHVSGAREFTGESDPVAPAGVQAWLQVQPLQPPCRTSSKGY